MPHLNEQQLASFAFEGTGDAHVAGCIHCQRRLDELREGLELARADEVPEPDAVTLARLHRGVMEQVEVLEHRRRWLMWPGLAAAALLAIATAISVTRAPEPMNLAGAPVWSALPPLEQDVGFTILEGVAPDQELLEARGGCLDLASCLMGLNESERLALVGELRDELSGRES